MACDKAIDVHRYHDGELPPRERTDIEAHFRECAQCRETLADLRGLSSLISAASMAPMPAAAVDRLQAFSQPARERGVLRISGWLTAAAAAVMVFALLQKPAERADLAAGPPVWETLPVMSPSELQDAGGSDTVLLAQFMADDLSIAGSGGF